MAATIQIARRAFLFSQRPQPQQYQRGFCVSTSEEPEKIFTRPKPTHAILKTILENCGDPNRRQIELGELYEKSKKYYPFPSRKLFNKCLHDLRVRRFVNKKTIKDNEYARPKLEENMKKNFNLVYGASIKPKGINSYGWLLHAEFREPEGEITYWRKKTDKSQSQETKS